MFCPKCKSEFIEGVYRCPDCDTDLVARLPDAGFLPSGDKEPIENYDWIMIFHPVGAQELAMIKMILERENIPYFIGNDNTRRAALYTPVNLAFELWVPQDFAERTLQLLKDELALS